MASQNDVAQLRDGGDAERTLGQLDEEVVLPRMAQMWQILLAHKSLKMRMSSKKTRTNRDRNGHRTSFMRT